MSSDGSRQDPTPLLLLSLIKGLTDDGHQLDTAYCPRRADDLFNPPPYLVLDLALTAHAGIRTGSLCIQRCRTSITYRLPLSHDHPLVVAALSRRRNNVFQGHQPKQLEHK